MRIDLKSFLESYRSLLSEGRVVAAATLMFSVRILQVRLVLRTGAAVSLIRCLGHVALILVIITINLGQLFFVCFFLLLLLKI